MSLPEATERPAARVLVLGATSAVATACAELYAARGARLHLVGRDASKLDALAERLRGRARQTVTTDRADFLDASACERVVAGAWDALGGVDSALLAHGDLGDQMKSESDFAEAERILRVNLLSAVALVVPLANRMEAARRGRLGVITSVAGERGRPRNFTYGAAKGGLGLYLQGQRSRLWPSGVRVTTIKLGPVDTPMTASHRKNVLFSRPETVAPRIVAAIERGAGECFVPGWWRPVMWAVRNTPEALFQRVRGLSGR